MSTAVNGTFSTFRDPAGQLSLSEKYANRTVRPEYASAAREFLGSKLCAQWQSSGKMVGTEVISDGPDGLCLRHPRLFLASYPWEWSVPQWGAAAELTLEMCDEAVQQGWLLKDATPLNVLFEGARPVFVDVLSFDRREPENPIWLAYGQFVRTFLLPLIAKKWLGWPLATSMLNRDGYEPQDIYRALSPLRKIHPRLLWPVTFPALLEKRADRSTSGSQTQRVRRSPETAKQVLLHTIATLRRQTRNAADAEPDSHWTDYTATASHYSSGEAEEKHRFVDRVLQEHRPAAVLDIGCNTGNFSALAAQHGAKVVALDSDIAAVGIVWSRAKSKGLDITSLVANLARPTPAVGWDNAESFSLLDRLAGKFDLVLMLAVIHHMLLSEQIPLDRIATLVSRLTRKWLVLEWVPVSDPMYQKLMRGRDELYGSLRESDMLGAFTRHFEVVERHPLTNGRVLFLLRVSGC